MADDYSDIFDEMAGNAAGNTIAAQGVKPDDAARAYNNRAVSPPSVGMHNAVEVEGMARARGASTISKNSPAITSWAQDPVRAAATSDDYAGLAAVAGARVWSDFSKPIVDTWKNLGQSWRRAYAASAEAQPGDPMDWRSWVPGGAANSEALAATAGTVLSFGGIIPGVFNIGISPAADALSEIPMVDETGARLSKEEARAKAEHMLNMSLWGLGSAGARMKAGAAAGEAGAAKAPPPGPSGPAGPKPARFDNHGRAEVSPEGFVLDGDGAPVTFTDQKAAAQWIVKEGNAKSPDQIFEIANGADANTWVVQQTGRSRPTPEAPGPGVDPVFDLAHAKRADDFATQLADLEASIVETKTFTRSPELMAEFLEQQAPGVMVRVDPAALQKIWASGDERPFSGLLYEIGQAIRAGDDLVVPLSQYLAEVAGKPYAAALHNAVSPDGGLSKDGAKILAEQQEAIANAEAKAKEVEAEGGTPDPADAVEPEAPAPSEDGTPAAGEDGVVLEPVEDPKIDGGALPEESQPKNAEDEALSLAAEDGYEFLHEYYSKQTGKEFPEPRDIEGEFFPDEVEALEAAKPVAKAAAEQVIKEQFLGKLFKDAEAIGMTKPQYELYSKNVEEAFENLADKLWKKTFSNVKAQYTRQFKDTYEKYYPVVLNELMSKPVVQAAHALRFSDKASPLAQTALKTDGKPTTFYHGTGHVDIEKWQVGKSHHKVISFSYDPEFASNWAGISDAYHTPLVYITHILAKNPADFRKEGDVRKAAKWFTDKYARESYVTDPHSLENYMGTMINRLRRGEWSLWETPEMWKAFGWDAAHMRENANSPSLNISVADGEQVFFKYNSGIDEMGYKISTSAKKDYDAALWASIPQNMWSRENGMSPDKLAGVFGFESGHQLLRELGAFEAQRKGVPFRKFFKDYVDGKVRQLAVEEVGDLLSPERIYADASNIFAAPEITDILIAELQALAAREGLTLDKDQIRDEALTQFDETRVERAMRIRDFELVMGRQGRTAEVALLRRKYLEAFQAKQKQLLNHYKLIEAHNLARQYPKTITKWRNWAKRSTISNMNGEAQAWIQYLLNRMGFRTSRPLADLERELGGKKFPEFVAEALAEGYPIVVAAIPVDPNNPNAFLTPPKMTVQDFRDVVEMLDSIAKMGRNKQSLFVEGKRVDKELLLEEMARNGRGLPPKPPSRRMGGGDDKDFATRLRGWDAAHRKIENISKFLDGDAIGGVFQRVLVEPAQRSMNQMSRMERELVEPIYKAFNEALSRSALGSKLDQIIEDHPFLRPLEGDAFLGKMDVTYRDLFIIALNSGNRYNLRVLAQGYGTEEDEVLRFLNEHMDEPAWRWVQEVWDLFDNTLFPMLEEVQRRITGVGLAKVQADAVATPFGELRGGYFPIFHDPNFGKIREASNPMEEMFQGIVATPSSMTKKRTGAVQPLWISLNGAMDRGLTQVLKRISFAEYMQSANNFISTSKVRRYVVEKMGKEYYDQFRPWLQNIINDNPLTPQALGGIEKIARAVRLNWTMTFIGGSASVAISQISGWATTTAMIGPTATAHGYLRMGQLVAQGKLEEFLFTRSEFMQQRLRQVDRDLIEARRSMGKFGRLNAAMKINNAAREFAMNVIGYADLYGASSAAWLGGYWKAVNELDLPESKAIAYADSVVRESQGSGRATDLALVQRPRTEIAKLFTVAYTFFSAFYNMQVVAVRNVRQGGGGGRKPPGLQGEAYEFPFEPQRPNPQKLAKGFGMLFMLLIAMPLADAFLKDALRGELPDFTDPEEVMKWAIPRLVFGAFGGVVGARDVGLALERKFTGKYGKQSAATPVVTAFEAMDDLATTAVRAGEVVAGDRDVDEIETSKKPIQKWLINFGVFGALPAGAQLGKTLQYIADVYEGKATPESPWDFTVGVLTGKDVSE